MRLDVPTGQIDDRLGVIPDITHRDRRVELDLTPDEMLERDDATLPVVVRRHALPTQKIDKEVFDAGYHDAEFCREQDRRLVIGMLPERRNVVLPLLDGDAGTFPHWPACRELRALPGIPLWRDSITKISAGAAQ